MKKVLITLLLASFASQLSAMENALPNRLRNMCKDVKTTNGGRDSRNCELLSCFFARIKNDSSHISAECNRPENEPTQWNIKYHTMQLTNEVGNDSRHSTRTIAYAQHKACKNNRDNEKLCGDYTKFVMFKYHLEKLRKEINKN